ncbi:hypothetical protein GPECTOR_56g339 [Gonium pectorale]|uniref:Uncharacterized protein n=1 Tax=Gonium pectorale TaxID=33097 RepID=A0A150G645_GONPE|nr:hypothetical protein GPECTOR_56g339 [Gonium pectorale]|eukprot:KXZ45243.1 hypothetical protein GPECTOR_56g339 [Gonium pectorale]
MEAETPDPAAHGARGIGEPSAAGTAGELLSATTATTVAPSAEWRADDVALPPAGADQPPPTSAGSPAAAAAAAAVTPAALTTQPLTETTGAGPSTPAATAMGEAAGMGGGAVAATSPAVAAPQPAAGGCTPLAAPPGADFEVRRLVYDRDLLRHQLKASAAEKEMLRGQMRSLQQQLNDTLAALESARQAAAAAAAANGPYGSPYGMYGSAAAEGPMGPSPLAAVAAAPRVVPHPHAAGPSGSPPMALLAAGSPAAAGLPDARSGRLFSVFDSAAAAAMEAAAEGVGVGAGAEGPLVTHGSSGPIASGAGLAMMSGGGGGGLAQYGGQGLPPLPPQGSIASSAGGGMTPLRIQTSRGGPSPTARPPWQPAPSPGAGSDMDGLAGGGGGGGLLLPLRIRSSANGTQLFSGAASPGGGALAAAAPLAGGGPSGLHAFSQPEPEPFAQPSRSAMASHMASVATSPRYGSLMTSVAPSPARRLTPAAAHWGPGGGGGGGGHVLHPGGGSAWFAGGGGSRLASRPASPPAHSGDLLAAIQKLEAMTGAGGELRPAVEAEWGEFGIVEMERGGLGPGLGGGLGLGPGPLGDERLVTELREEVERLRAQVRWLAS